MTRKEAEKLAWMAKQHNQKAAKTLLAARDAEKYIKVYDEEDGEDGMFYVRNNGTGYYAGSCEYVKMVQERGY